jgi:hypothetical protein
MTWGRFHQLSTYSFHAQGAQMHEKDSQVVIIFTLLGSTGVKAEKLSVNVLVKLTPGGEVTEKFRVEDEAVGSGEGSREGPALNVECMPDVHQFPVVSHDAVRRPPIP